MRAHYRMVKGTDDDMINIIFGSDEQDNWDRKKDALKGSVSVSDAKLLAFPMRSDLAPFVWITSPEVLKRFFTDLEYTAIDNDGFETKLLDGIKEEEGMAINTDMGTKDVILEDAQVKIKGTVKIAVLQNYFPFVNRLICVSDEMYSYCVDHSTEVQTHIKIDGKTGTASTGALRYEELLPADSLLYSVVIFGPSAYEIEEQAKMETIRNELKSRVKDFMQIGGDETLGKGICKVQWIGG
jgi:CRISPR-associated protein Cmr4